MFWFVLHSSKKRQGVQRVMMESGSICLKIKVTAEILDLFFFSFKKSNGNSQGLIRLSNNLHRRRCTKTKKIMSTSLDSIW